MARAGATAVRGAESWHGDPAVGCFAVHAALIIRVRGGQDHPLNPGISLRQQIVDVPVLSHGASRMAEHPSAQAARGSPGVDIHAFGEMDLAQGSNSQLHGPTQLDP